MSPSAGGRWLPEAALPAESGRVPAASAVPKSGMLGRRLTDGLFGHLVGVVKDCGACAGEGAGRGADPARRLVLQKTMTGADPVWGRDR